MQLRGACLIRSRAVSECNVAVYAGGSPRGRGNMYARADDGTQTIVSALPRPALSTPGLCKCGYCSTQDAVLFPVSFSLFLRYNSSQVKQLKGQTWHCLMWSTVEWSLVG